MSSEVECNAFLSALKHHYKIGKLDFIFGKKNKYALTNLGISISDALITVMELTSENYYRGPEKDHKDLEQAVWKFGNEYYSTFQNTILNIQREEMEYGERIVSETNESIPMKSVIFLMKRELGKKLKTISPFHMRTQSFKGFRKLYEN